MWAREFPDVQFERYCDDAVVHCASEREARVVRDAIARRLADCRLELHAGKTRIVYCKDSNRDGPYEHEQFTFLGYTFRARRAQSKRGATFASFSPAVSNEAAKEGRQAIKRWRLHRWSEVTLTDVARSINGIVRGWANHYGRFYPSEFARSLRRINDYLVRWAMWKYKRLRRHPARAWQLLASVARREPDLVAHWRLGLRPDGWGRWEPGELRGSRRVLRAPRCLRSNERRKHIRWTLSIVTIL
jgi:RNA-directed DNA polymerase